MSAEHRSALPILYSFRRCPFAIRARMAISVAAVDVEVRDILLKDRPDALKEASQKATVPVLVLGDGNVLEESLDIMDWALHQSDPEHWCPSPSIATESRRLIQGADGPFKKNLDRYKYATRYADCDPLEARMQAEQIIDRWNDRLSNHAFLFGDTCQQADVAIFPLVRQFVRADAEWFATTEYAAIRSWVTRFETSARFTSIMRKLEIWQPESPPRSFREAYR